MKISAQNAETFIRSLPSGVRAVLLYGPDVGLVRERMKRIVATVVDNPDDPFAVADLTAATLAKEPARLLDEVLAIAFGGGRRAVVIGDGGDELVRAVKAVLEDTAAENPKAGAVVIAAGNLGPRSALRRLFEGDAACAALPCYPDDEAALAALVRSSLAAEGIAIDAAGVAAAAAMLGGDREANRRELEKLVLFAGPEGRLDEAAVTACLGNSAAASVDEAIFAAADGSYENLSEQLSRVWSEGIEPVAVIRSAQRHFQLLHYLVSQSEAGVSVEGALKQVRPPIFWRTADRLRSQANRWSAASAAASLARLTEAELSAKSTGVPSALVCDRALLAIAQLARTGARK